MSLKPLLPMNELPKDAGRILVRLKGDARALNCLPTAFADIAGAFLLVDKVADRQDVLVLTGTPDIVFDDVSVFSGWMPLDIESLHPVNTAFEAVFAQQPVFKTRRQQLDT